MVQKNYPPPISVVRPLGGVDPPAAKIFFLYKKKQIKEFAKYFVKFLQGCPLKTWTFFKIFFYILKFFYFLFPFFTCSLSMINIFYFQVPGRLVVVFVLLRLLYIPFFLLCNYRYVSAGII